ncbi:hypothetical protein [Lysobacter sp. CA199]|uniref:hypothetical protein n=1 Tax=Lysobacter sp. CA199 TaxID=3455608 RepID=UPI003F8D0DA7
MHRTVPISLCLILLAMPAHARASQAPSATARAVSTVIVASAKTNSRRTNPVTPAQSECIGRIPDMLIAEATDSLIHQALSADERAELERFYLSDLGTRSLAAVAHGEDPERTFNAGDRAALKRTEHSAAYRKLLKALPPYSSAAKAVLEPLLLSEFGPCLKPELPPKRPPPRP